MPIFLFCIFSRKGKLVSIIAYMNHQQLFIYWLISWDGQQQVLNSVDIQPLVLMSLTQATDAKHRYRFQTYKLWSGLQLHSDFGVCGDPCWHNKDLLSLNQNTMDMCNVLCSNDFTFEMYTTVVVKLQMNLYIFGYFSRYILLCQTKIIKLVPGHTYL